MGTAIEHPEQDWVKPSFVIFAIRALDAQGWHRMLYSCIHVTTVGVKGLN